ncbi:MAG: pirin family protein [Chitinophagaceae bacterium]
MKTIKGKYKAVYEPIADLVTYRAMPTSSLSMNRLDPFIFLNHHGPQQYPPHNAGLPFGPHPHRGFETVTFILEGDLTHKDSSSGTSIINAGGVQWMTAGSGVVHAEISSDEFKKHGGPLEILQLWINLPAKYKMAVPHYTGLQAEEIPTITKDDGKVAMHLVAGKWDTVEAPVKPITDIHLAWIYLKESGRATFTIPPDQTVFFYVARGTMKVNGEDVAEHYIVEFSHDGSTIELKALTDAIILFGYATPFHEPFVAYGPFVMNTHDEIQQAYKDYHEGKFGDSYL